jgi:hypothetical protein
LPATPLEQTRRNIGKDSGAFDAHSPGENSNDGEKEKDERLRVEFAEITFPRAFRGR